MLLVLTAVAALAGAEPQEGAGAAQASSPATAAAKPQVARPLPSGNQVCIRERPTGSNRLQTICYDKDAYEATQDALKRNHVRQGSPVGGMGVGK
jgi:hypothetical protein